MKLCLNHVMRRPCSAILGLMLGLCACVFPLPLSSQVLYVSPSGSDSNPGTLSQPFLTIQKCATTATSGGTCEVRAGTYHETVTPNSGITITSYNGESVTVDGTDPVTYWTPYQGSIYQASVTMASGSNQNQTFANQVFVGSQMMTEAQWPAPTANNDLFHVNWETMQSGTTQTKIVDSNLPNINWTGAHIHLWSGSDPWSHLTGAVTASSRGRLTISIDDSTWLWCPEVCPAAGGYYYLFGALGALTTANQWFYNSSTGVLYFWAPGGVNPNTLSVSAKQRQYGFDLSNASNVTIENINLFACSINTNVNSTNNTFNGMNAQYISHFTYLEGDGGYSESGIILSGSGNSLINSTLAYSAGNGVVVVNGSNATIENNLIHHVDYMGDETAGVVICGTMTGNLPVCPNAQPVSNVTIENNTIYAAGRATIDMNPPGIQGVEIGYNNLYGSMMLSTDSGEIYFCCGVFTGTDSIDHNWIHDTQEIVPAQQSNSMGTMGGVYLDGGTSGWAVDQNVIWNNVESNIFLNGTSSGPEDNNVSNNTIPDVNPTGYILVGYITCGTTQVVNNLVLISVVNDSNCTASNNNASAPGATDMTSSVQVGCNFTGCSSEAPPAISGNSVAASIAVQPRSVTVNPGQTATFTVTAAGSPTLSYQWQMNGTSISGATAASYTTAPTTTANNGEVFTVQVSNSVGGATSAPATLTVNGAPASIKFVQVNSDCNTSLPPSSSSSVAVAYSSAQTSGDLNIVVVGWNNPSATVSSLTDSNGNSYSVAVGPTTYSPGPFTQTIYYASKVKAGSNTVTVNFSQNASYPDVRIAEYRGVSTLDKTSAATGSSATSFSGAAITSYANELVFGSNMVASCTSAPGTGFTSRLIDGDGDIVEDEIVAATGSYNASATLCSSGAWIAQMATFH